MIPGLSPPQTTYPTTALGNGPALPSMERAAVGSNPVLRARELETASRGAGSHRGGSAGSSDQSASGFGAQLKMERDRNGALAAFLQPRRPVTARRPHPALVPSRIGVVEAAVQALGIKPASFSLPIEIGTSFPSPSVLC